MEPIYNKKAQFDYFLEQKMEAGIILEGWEVKALAKRNVNFDACHVYIKNGEIFLFNVLITPLESCSTHEIPYPSRTRKLLMSKKQISEWIGKVEKKGYTIVPVKIYQNKKRKYKVEIALGKGKKNYDKRAVQKENDWKMEQSRIMKKNK